MTKTLHIGLDMDMVLAVTDEPWYARYTRQYGHALTRNMVTDWEVHTLVHPDCGRSYYSLRTPDMYADEVKPVPRALAGVALLLASGHRLTCISSENHPEQWYDAKQAWLARWFPGIPELEVTDHHRKAELPVDVLVDDALHNILPPPRYTVLLNYPWNLGRPVPAGVRRADNWTEVVRHLLALAAGEWEEQRWPDPAPVQRMVDRYEAARIDASFGAAEREAAAGNPCPWPRADPAPSPCSDPAPVVS